VRILTQNIQWGGEPKAPGSDGEPRLERLVGLLAKMDADLLVLTEFKSGELADELKVHLAKVGYLHFKYHIQAPFKLGTAIAARRPIKVIELPVPSTVDSWRSIGVSVDGIDVFGFYFPLNEAKEQYWDWLIANAEKLRDHDVILAGDFNTGKIRIDEAGETFDCQDKHEALEKLGFVDTWRASYPKGRDYTWYSSSGNGFRLDYIWASPSLAPHIQHLWHDHEARLTQASDHSAVLADISIPVRGIPHD
jgi:exodeoxyribonuclease-3